MKIIFFLLSLQFFSLNFYYQKTKSFMIIINEIECDH
jgi:hypothetical protein